MINLHFRYMNSIGLFIASMLGSHLLAYAHTGRLLIDLEYLACLNWYNEINF